MHYSCPSYSRERERGEGVARWVLFVYISGHLYAYNRTETARQHYLP